jgi:hypothetical protein
VGPDDLCIRRQVTLRGDGRTLAEWRATYRERIKVDPRADLPDRPAILGSATQHAFAIGDDEFIGGAPAAVAEEIVDQCRRAGAGHFAVIFERAAGPKQIAAWYREFGAAVIPTLRKAEV